MAEPSDLPVKPPPAARPSGLPRMSRLPVSALKPTSANGQPAPRLRNVASTGKLASASPKLEKPATARRGFGSTVRVTQSRDIPSKTKAEDVFKKPVGRPPPRQTRERTQTSSSSGTQDGDRSTLRSSSSLSLTDTTISEEPALRPRKGPRPSLSDRTIESLANIPATPKDRRRSSFFSPQSPLDPPTSRPESAMFNRRPGSSDSSTTHVRNATISGRPGTLRPTSPMKKAPNATTAASVQKTSLRSTVSRVNARAPISGSKTMVARTPQSRPGLSGLFDKPKADEKSKATKPTRPTVASAARAVKPLADKPDVSPRKASGSAALREQIRLAKTKHRRESERLGEEEPDFDLVADPFNQQPKDGESALSKRVAEGRLEGRLNISAMGLKEMPSAVLNMYEVSGNASDSVAWGEFVDLVKLSAADNDLQIIPDEMFPNELEEDKALQFGGLESLDLHGNLLQSVPLGFRRLERLTVLNLSRNKLSVDCFDIIAQMPYLRELRLADNMLEGTLPSSISAMESLEVLELQGNKLSMLPDSLGDLIRLRVLNVANNVLEGLPIEPLAQLPLVELVVSKNKLSGALFSSSITELSRIQRIDVANNQLTALSDAHSLHLPTLKDLDISINRISTLPDMSTWTNLGTFIAEDNQFTACPPGFTTLQFLRTVNFTGNDFSKLDPEIGRMDGLTSLQIAANPIRESKFLSMNTEQIKNSLKARLAAPAVMDPLLEMMQSMGQGRNSTVAFDPLVGLPKDTYWAQFEEVSRYNVSLNYFEKLWMAWYAFMQNDVLATGVMSFTMHELVYFGRSLPWIIIDCMPWMRKYKIQHSKIPTAKEQWSCALLVLLSHFTVELPQIWLFHPMAQYFGLSTSVPFPSVLTMAFQIGVFFVMEDAWHYWTHRAMHATPFLYKNVHKIHHQYSAPFGLAAEYASPIEVMMLGFGTVMCPILWCALTGDLHILTMYLWIVFRLFQAIDAHSGYEFPWSLHHFLPFWAGADHHDTHHEKFTGNYASSFRWWDYCLDTESSAEANERRRAAKSLKKAQ